MNKKRDQIILFLAVIILIGVNYSWLDKKITGLIIENEFGIVERVIDGDTIIINNESVRLLGINSPERGEIYYNEAKEFLKNLTLNKTIELRFGNEKYDLYKRRLAYIYLNNKNVNLEVVKNGYANFYFPSGKEQHYKDFLNGWELCLEKEINLCELSEDKCASCIELKELNVNNQKIILYNSCDFSCDLTGWNIKDEGRKKLVLEKFILNEKSEMEIIVGNEKNSKNTLYWKDESYVWTKTGDSLFLRDDGGKLVLWHSY